MRAVEERARSAYRHVFHAEPDVVASGPGRVNLIGEHTDYSGGFALPCAIPRRVAVAMGAGAGDLYSDDFHDLEPLNGCKGSTWAAYPRGVAWAFAERGHSLPPFRAAFAGDVPVASGLSSSAAIETGTALALAHLADLDIPRKEIALLCQRAENGFVGVQSGILDQFASLLCHDAHALLIDCRSLDADQVPLPLEDAGLVLAVCDTRVERELGNTGYNDRRRDVERAAAHLGKTQLRDATIQDVERLDGVERLRAEHVVTENARVLAAVKALRDGDFVGFGRLMYESHASLRDLFQVSTPELDTFVEAAKGAGALGARLTGAGFGGCGVALIDLEAYDDLEKGLRSTFREHGFSEPELYAFTAAGGAQVVSG